MEQFQRIVWEYYQAHGRHALPWRRLENDDTLDPYKVFVSELMLQQTQVSRVVPKFEAFIKQFPTIQSLAAAPLAEVLIVWNGLGYNRRAKFLRQAANMVVGEYGGHLPQTVDQLIRLPGVGHNTAGAIAAYAYNRPVVFVETNIRTAFIYYFFADKQRVTDGEIAGLLSKTLPGAGAGNLEETSYVRHWYWALMDYGSYLKQAVGNLNKQSMHYAKQSAFHGSRRQIRGQVLRALSATARTHDEIRRLITDERLDGVLDDLLREGMIARGSRYYKLADS